MPSNAEIREANINSALEDVENDIQDTSTTEQDDIQQNEPVTKTFSREEYVNDTYNEGTEEAVIEELALVKGDLTIDDLRQIPGTEGLSDAEVEEAWQAAQKEAGIASGEAGETKVELPFPVYDAQGNKVDADKVTLEDLLSGNVQIGYQAMDKEHRKTLTELYRNASQAHWNEHRYNTVQGQYKTVSERAARLEREAASHTEMQSQWRAALNALSFGDVKPITNILNAYKAELTKAGNAPPAGFVAEDTIRQQRELEQAGMQWWTNEGLPAAYDIASRYGANRAEVQKAVEFYIDAEGSNLTQDRVKEIFQYDVPMLLEKNGYSATGNRTDTSNVSNAGQPNNEVAELRKQIQAQASAIAEMKNGRVAATREKSRRIPSAGSGATPGAGDSMPSNAVKDRASMKEYLQS